MGAILVMLNNYLHDFATAMVVVSSYAMLLMVRYAEGGEMEVKRMVLRLYPKMLHLTAGSFIFLLFAGVIRAFTFRDYEWFEAAGKGQVYVLMVKHILLFILFGYGMYLWIVVHRRIKRMRRVVEG